MEMPKPGPADEKFSLFAGNCVGDEKIVRGAFDADVLTMTSESPMGHSRCTFDFTRAGKYDTRLESSPDGSQWAPFIEGSYARK